MPEKSVSSVKAPQENIALAIVLSETLGFQRDHCLIDDLSFARQDVTKRSG